MKVVPAGSDPRAGRPRGDHRARNSSGNGCAGGGSKSPRRRSRATSRSWRSSSTPPTAPTACQGERQPAGPPAALRDRRRRVRARGSSACASWWSSAPRPARQASSASPSTGRALEEVAGTVAGDDTLLVIVRDAKRARAFVKMIEALGEGVIGFERVREGSREKRHMQRIVLAYSGGLDTSVAIPWLAEQYGARGRGRHARPRARGASSKTSASARSRSARCARTSWTSARSSRASSSCRR